MNSFYINGESVRKALRQLLSPVFLLILLATTLMWFASELSRQYTTEIPLHIRVEGEKYRLTAVVQGYGSTILAQRLSLNRKPAFTLEELFADPSGGITLQSLVRAIDPRLKNLTVVQIVEAPGLLPETEPTLEQ